MNRYYNLMVQREIDHSSNNGVNIRYGHQPEAFNMLKQIMSIDDVNKRHAEIDKMIKFMGNNSETNGFFDVDENIEIGIGESNAIKMDDVNLYYQFVDTLRANLISNAKSDNKKGYGEVMRDTIKGVIKYYFGELEGNIVDINKRRNALTDTYTNDLEGQSVANLKGQNCAKCVERNSVAHNLWLLCGRPSNYIVSTSIKIGNDEAHAFNIVQVPSGKYALFDMSMNIVKLLPNNPIEDMLHGKPLQVTVMYNGKPKTYVYANAENLNKEEYMTR